jgi:biopolymer transport protein ExbD
MCEFSPRYPVWIGKVSLPQQKVSLPQQKVPAHESWRKNIHINIYRNNQLFLKQEQMSSSRKFDFTA